LQVDKLKLLQRRLLHLRDKGGESKRLVPVDEQVDRVSGGCWWWWWWG
jgi:hypothetical protein